jgi:ABC-type antimicrobial peptide transport system permease subunit
MGRMKIITRLLLITLLICVLATMSVEVSRSIPLSSEIQAALPLPPSDYVTSALQALNMTQLEGYVKTFSSFGTRITGSLGCYRAAQYIYNEFKAFGLAPSYNNFSVTVPVDGGAYVTLPTGVNVTLYPFLPNIVCPVQTPPGGITGKLIYVGEGEVSDFDGKEVDGSIVLMDMNTEYNWLTAAKYGAKAVIFIEPNDSSTQEFNQKVLDTAAYYFPRLYVKAEDAQKLESQEGATVNLVSNMKFEQVVSSNVIAYLQGRAYADKYILLTASYDSYSYVPSLAPGAREAIGISMLLQLAKFFASHPGSNQYTLVFIAFSGTDEGVIGSRWFVYQNICQNWNSWGSNVELQMNFDIDDVNRFIAPSTDDGWLWGFGEGCGQWLAGGNPFNTWLFHQNTTAEPWPGLRQDLAQRLNKMFPPFTYLNENWTWLNSDPNATINGELAEIVRSMCGNLPYTGGWNDQLGGPLRYSDSEPLALLGGPSFSWSNWLAFEKYTYTPFDTPDRINWEIIEYKLTAIYPIVYATVNTDLSSMIDSYWGPSSANTRNGPTYADTNFELSKWVDIEGKIAQYNVTTMSWDPIPNALFMYRSYPPGGDTCSSWQIPRWCYVTANSSGWVFAPGCLSNYGSRLLPEGRPEYDLEIRAYVINESTGQITYAPAFGLNWYPSSAIGGNMVARIYSTFTPTQKGVRLQSFGVYTLFKCGNVVMFDLGDPYFRSAGNDMMASVVVNSFTTHSILDTSSWETYIFGGQSVSIATMHVPPDEPIEIMAQTGYTGNQPFEVLTNSSANNPSGTGYTVGAGKQITITYTTFRAAYDWFNQNNMREVIISKSAVAPPARLEVRDTKPLFDDAFQAIRTNNYTELESLQYKLLVIERNQYGALRGTIADAVNAITFFGFILIPFAIIFERLVGQLKGMKRIVMIALAYGLPTLVLYYAHPGFALASNSAMVLVGFLVLVLTSPLLVIIYTSFLDALKKAREKAMGVHWIEMGRTNVALLSFSLGVLNMRKRRLRTSLTLISVLLITVGVVLFTSIGAVQTISQGSENWSASYSGIFVHYFGYGRSYNFFDKYSGLSFSETTPQIGNEYLTELEIRYGDKFIIAPRAWDLFYSGRGWMLTTEDGSKWISTRMLAVLGLTPQEVNVTVTMPNAGLVKGTWFTEDMDPYVTIIGKQVADQLKVTIGDKIKLSGYDFKIVGIANETILNHVLDLDDLGITPMDTRVSGTDSRLYLGTENVARENTPAETMIIPYKTVLSAFDGQVVSVSMRLKPEYEGNQTLLFSIAKEIYMETLHGSYSIPLYYGYKGETVQTLSPQNVVTTSGWGTQAAPLIIAALVILNLMLGSIEERKKDIFTLSSVGLSPFHIGFLFFAEALTYSVIGGVGGYLGSLLLAPFGTSISLNPASTTVVTAVTSMMAVTIAVTIYPIYIASKLVTPSLERRWKLPKPKGDMWEIILPFSSTRDDEVDGLLTFTHELVTVHLAPDSEVFRTVTSIKYSEEETPQLLNRTMIFDSELSPYELGIFQDTRIVDVKEKDIGRHTIHINLYRKAGPKGSWMTFGREFVDLMRKQIMLWRNLTEEERKQYGNRFAELKRSMK